MNRTELFLQTIQDLRARIASGTEYDLLMTAGLLRKLLLDGDRLVDQVNRQYRMKLRFRYTGPTAYEDMILQMSPTFWSVADRLSARESGPPGLRNPVEGSLKQFLGRRALLFDREMLDVGGVIRHVANVEGAVHRARPEATRDDAVAAVNASIRIGGVPPATYLLKAICEVTLEGLAPLVEKAGGGAP